MNNKPKKEPLKQPSKRVDSAFLSREIKAFECRGGTISRKDIRRAVEELFEEKNKKVA
ncbi:MAG: hypothetical protein SFU25_10900 [Candidatus Caenarcaniphilales bacterium]|nr:hypothetical protein [Candidatus Caenarcaniphilales bacterium]